MSSIQFFSTLINQFASGLSSSSYLPGKIRLIIIEFSNKKKLRIIERAYIYIYIYVCICIWFLIFFLFFIFENVYGFLLNFHINFQVNKDEVGVLFHKIKKKKEKKWVSSPLTPGKYRSNDVRKDEEALQTHYR